MKTIIIIPVYNEKKNIHYLLSKIRKLNKFPILYINDNSNDGTTQEIKKLQKKNKNIFHMLRTSKSGIGSAHMDGLIWCYKKNYDLIVTMDGDGTHDPKYIKKMIEKTKKNHITISNRFLKKNSLKTWPLLRIFITYSRYYLIFLLLGIKFDASGAFRCINRKKVNLKDLILKDDTDYSYFWKSIYMLSLKYDIKEISIDLPYRKQGDSKMKLKHIFSSLIKLLFFSFKKK
ncbi:MAG: hypothetical protein CBC25_00800 [Pelagibacteraceae bacterium TMED65]|nr:MAG: hypothetical protein CBC25_00800 [Pelagibacteraceae bacterium TMED65]|tara:strand:- start:2385 stop:3077 length:693 start_codon:yes stop_codon:yes gene_type:complete